MPQFPGAEQWVPATGGLRARMMLVGEQQGDVEDELGHPFVGQAGRLLDRALAGAGADRSDVFLTNAVKHFRYTRMGNEPRTSACW